MQVDDRAVADVNYGQRRAVGLDEQHRDVFVVERAANRLGQRGGGQQGRDQHDAADIMSGEFGTQGRDVGGVCPGHARRHQPVAAFDRTLAGADQRGHRGSGCALRAVGRVELERVFLDRHPVRINAFDQHQANRTGLHRYPEHDVHSPSKPGDS
ncbi:hypothetical protein OSJ16_09245 [Mycobacterium ulcerans]